MQFRTEKNKIYIMSNLLESLKGLVTKEMLNTTATTLGESETNISKALNGILPSVLGSITNTGITNHSLLTDLLTKAAGNSDFLGEVMGSITGTNRTTSALGMGNNLVSNIFGSKINGMTNLVSNYAGIKSSSAGMMLSMGGSLVASFLGKKMTGEGLNISGILSWLGGQQESIISAIPSEFANFLGGDLGPDYKNFMIENTPPVVDEENTAGGMKWLMPLILLGLLGVGMWYWLKGCNKEGADAGAAQVETSVNQTADSAAAAIKQAADTTMSIAAGAADALKGHLDEAGNWIAEKGEAIKLKLENGIEIDAFKGSLEDKLLAFIKDQNAVAGKDVWFNFEDLLFDTGKSTLKAESKQQLENTAAILKAYPNVKVKLGGYTDNTGDSMANMKLSDARAKMVYNQLLSKGVSKTSFDEKPYEGYGPMHPVGDNATAEGRGQNRRISVSVRAK
jgi:OOP family OmpA-OmpF porin